MGLYWRQKSFLESKKLAASLASAAKEAPAVGDDAKDFK